MQYKFSTEPYCNLNGRIPSTMSAPLPLTDVEKLAILDHHTYHSTISTDHTVSRTLFAFSAQVPSLINASTDFINKIDEEGLRKRTRHEIGPRTLADYGYRLSALGNASQDPRPGQIVAQINSLFNLELEAKSAARFDNNIRTFNSLDRGSSTSLQEESASIASNLKSYTPNSIYFFNEINIKHHDRVFTFSLAGNLSGSDFLDPLVVSNLHSKKFNYHPMGLFNSYHVETYLSRIDYQLKLQNRKILLICRNNFILHSQAFSNIEVRFVNLAFDKYFNRNYLKFPDEYGLNHWIKFNLANSLFQISDYTNPTLVMNSLIISYDKCIKKLLSHPIYHKFYQLNIRKSGFLGPDESIPTTDGNYTVVTDIYVVKNETYDSLPTNFYNNIFKFVDYNYSAKDIYFILDELKNFGQMSFACEVTLDEVTRFIDKKLLPFITNNHISSLSHFNAFFSKFINKEKETESPSYQEPALRVLSLPQNHFSPFKAILELDASVRNALPYNLYNNTYLEDNLFPKDDHFVFKNVSSQKLLTDLDEMSAEDNSGVSSDKYLRGATPDVDRGMKEIPQPSRMQNSSPNLNSTNDIAVTGVAEKVIEERPDSTTDIPSDNSQYGRSLKDRASISPNKFFNKVPSPPATTELEPKSCIPASKTKLESGKLPVLTHHSKTPNSHDKEKKDVAAPVVRKRKFANGLLPTVKKSKILEVLQKDKLSFVGSVDGSLFSDDSEESDNSFDPTRNERIRIRNESNKALTPSRLSNNVVIENLSDEIDPSESGSNKSDVIDLDGESPESSSSSDDDSDSDADYENPEREVNREPVSSDMEESGHDISKPIIIAEGPSAVITSTESKSLTPRQSISPISEEFAESPPSVLSKDAEQNGSSKQSKSSPQNTNKAQSSQFRDPNKNSDVSGPREVMVDEVLPEEGSQSELSEDIDDSSDDELNERFPVSQKRMIIKEPLKVSRGGDPMYLEVSDEQQHRDSKVSANFQDNLQKNNQSALDNPLSSQKPTVTFSIEEQNSEPSAKKSAEPLSSQSDSSSSDHSDSSSSESEHEPVISPQTQSSSPAKPSKSQSPENVESPHKLGSLKDLKEPKTTIELSVSTPVRRPVARKNAFKGRNEFSSSDSESDSESDSSSDSSSSEDEEPPKTKQTLPLRKRKVLFRPQPLKAISPKKVQSSDSRNLAKTNKIRK